MPTGRDSNLRTLPTQARSRETFERILSAAVQLLDEYGWDGFNTNLLAQRAGVRVSAVYRYFPNKEVVVQTLAERFIEEWDSWYDNFEQELQASGDFEQIWNHSIDLYYDQVKALPGALAIRRAMQVSPQLRAMDRADTQHLSERLTNTLANYYQDMGRARARAVATVLMESIVPVIDRALEASPAQARKLLDEIKTMHAIYMSTQQ